MPQKKRQNPNQMDELLEERKTSWENLTDEERKEAKRKISRSARNDYRDHVESVVQQIEEAHAVGRTSETFKLAKQLSGKKSSGNIQPSKDDQGNVITDTDQQLELWAEFLEKKFSQGPEE